MARIRSIKPEFWGDRKLAASVSRDGRLLYVALWNQADEWGRVQGDARWIKGHCLPYDDDLNLQAIDRLVDELADAGRVEKYQHEDDPYLFLPKLAEHQRLEPAKVPSRLPAPPVTTDLSVETDSSGSRADLSAPRADESGTNVALQVAGGREQGAGSRCAGDARPGAELVPVRRDVETLCSTLAELMIRNGCKPPTVTQKWRDAARLLLDRDGVTLNDAMGVLGWCQSDEFWRANVQSMPTFREKYDRLRLQAARSSPSDAKTRGHLELIQRLAQEGT
jgi:hypothetical protein